MGGGIEKGKKRKQKNEQEKKGGKKKYVENSGFGSQPEGISKSRTTFWLLSLFLNVVPTNSVEDLWIPTLPQPRTGIIHPLCADKDVAQIGNYCGKLQARTACCRLHDLLQRCNRGIINRASLYNQSDGFKNQLWSR